MAPILLSLVLRVYIKQLWFGRGRETGERELKKRKFGEEERRGKGDRGREAI